MEFVWFKSDPESDPEPDPDPLSRKRIFIKMERIRNTGNNSMHYILCTCPCTRLTCAMCIVLMKHAGQLGYTVEKNEAEVRKA